MSEQRLRCQYVSPTPWGPSQCALIDGHPGRHAYDPLEDIDDHQPADHTADQGPRQDAGGSL